MSGVASDPVSDDDIYTGIWINWSYGQVRGATLTLTHRNGGLVTAFLALFVTVVGRGFWRLFCFAAHSSFSSARTPQDGFYHQRQAVLRNASTSMVGLLYSVQIAFKWQNRTSRRWLRMLPVISVTALMTAGFYVASIFSSRVRIFC